MKFNFLVAYDYKQYSIIQQNPNGMCFDVFKSALYVNDKYIRWLLTIVISVFLSYFVQTRPFKKNETIEIDLN